MPQVAPPVILACLLAALAGGCTGANPFSDRFTNANWRFVGAENASLHAKVAHLSIPVPAGQSKLVLSVAYDTNGKGTLGFERPTGADIRFDEPNGTRTRVDESQWASLTHPEAGAWKFGIELSNGEIYYAVGAYWS